MNQLDERINYHVQIKYVPAIIEKASKLRYAYIEDANYYDLLTRMNEQAENALQTGCNALLYLLTVLFQALGIVLSIFVHMWWAAAVSMVMMLFIVLLAIKAGKVNYRVGQEITKDKRYHEYLYEVLTDREHVYERTLFNYSDYIEKVYQHIYDKNYKKLSTTYLLWYIRTKLGSFATTILVIILISVLLSLVLQSVLTIGVFISLVNALLRFIQHISWDLSYNLELFVSFREYVRELHQFLSLEEEVDDTQETVDRTFTSITFDNVSFKYPGSTTYTLKNLSLNLCRNGHYAFVGANGSGKTTIVKLLTGLYRDYEGHILIDGKELKDCTGAEIRALFAGVYQDFARYPISLRDNIYLGHMEHSDDDADEFILQELGIPELAKALPYGMETHLGKIEETGVDISGGQWQLIAIARAISNHAPFLILDEPTAALDPMHESSLYTEFSRWSQQRTSLIISHRLGSTKLAQEIFVIQQGCVVESGSHEHLLQKEGLYAQMYESQRSWYQ